MTVVLPSAVVIYSLIETEELIITQTNVDRWRTTRTVWLLGGAEDTGNCWVLKGP
jgi:hypothetical protein